jgi:hypothetical protein
VRSLILALIVIAAPALGATRRTQLTPSITVRQIAPVTTSFPAYCNWQSARSVRHIQEFDGTIEGHTYAQPLYWQPTRMR